MNKFKHFNQVKEFMTLFSQTINTEPKMPTLKTLALRLSLINEEISELREALYADDLVEIADALTDILYVVYGAYATFGTEPDIGPRGSPVGSVRIPNSSDSLYLLFTMQKAVQNIQDQFTSTAHTDQTLESASYYLDTLLDKVYSFAEKMKLDINSCFEEVHNSNMSKAVPTEEQALSSIQQRINEGKVEDYTGATIEKNGELFLIKRKSDGKILKGSNYFDPNLAQFIK